MERATTTYSMGRAGRVHTSLEAPRVGFLGLGWIGRHRMHAAVEAGRISACAVADSDSGAVEDVCRHHPGAVPCSSLDELLDQNLDAIVIATPSALHAEQSVEALQNGLSVFCQKPLGRSAEETAAVIEAARKANRLLGVDFSYRHVHGVRLMREMVRSGAIGDVFAVRAVFHNAYGPGKEWFYDRRLSGGGCVMDLGIHLVDLVLWTFDFPEVEIGSSRLFRRGARFTRNAEGVEDFAMAQIDLSNGVVADVACSWDLSTGCDAVIELDFHGTSGSLSMRNVEGSYFDFVVEHHCGRSTERIAEPPDEWPGRAICEWARQLATNPEFDPTMTQVLQVSEVLDAIYRDATIN